MSPALRQARCVCGKVRRSSPALPGFTSRAQGTYDAEEICRCGFARVAHEQEPSRTRINVVRAGKCAGFVARGEQPVDLFYCGCGGFE